MNTTTQLFELKQSIWYDNIQRGLLRNGELKGMIQRGEIFGVTSNPTIFMNAIVKSNDYDEGLLPLMSAGMSNEEIFFRLAIEDIQETADLFRPLYEKTNGGDGYVSLEVSPFLAHETGATVAQARELWDRVNRPNLMIKIPATDEGIPAIASAIEAGLNINVTLIFARQRGMQVMDAFLTGLERRAAAGLPIDRVASVASYFVSRIDSNIDGRLNKIITEGGPQAQQARALLAKAAIANTRLAYSDFKTVFSSKRFEALQAKGAQFQRPLWASTSTKNPQYRDVMYVEELVAPRTVNTVPPQTLAAFLDHGQVRVSIEDDLDGQARIMNDLEGLGISMDEVTRQLEVEAVKSFSDAFQVLLDAIESRRQPAAADLP